MVELHGVSKRLGEEAGLRPTDLTIDSQKTTCLIGPSGAGKSTLLRIMIGLVWPDRGEVRLSGKPLEPATILEQRRRIGYVIQDGGLFPHLSAQDNVSLMARHLGWKRAKIEHRISELSSLMRFPTDGLERFPSELSGGERQRVSLMRALMLDPVLLLLDEPLGALDPLIRSELQTDLRRIFQTLQKTVVLVTHDVEEAGFFGDVLVVLRKGEVVQKGTLDELQRHPKDPFVSRFLGAHSSPTWRPG